MEISRAHFRAVRVTSIKTSRARFRAVRVTIIRLGGPVFGPTAGKGLRSVIQIIKSVDLIPDPCTMERLVIFVNDHFSPLLTN